MLQTKIDKIIKSNIKNNEKFIDFKKLFKEYKINVFCDFDDTITNNINIYYSKILFLKLFNKYNKKNINFLLNEFILNNSFPKINQNIIIISKNDHDFIKKFLIKYWNYLIKNQIKIVWCIWNSKYFKFSSYDKINFLNSENIFIWDIFENKKLKKNKNYINVNKNIWLSKKLKIYLIKIIKLMIFLVKIK